MTEWKEYKLEEIAEILDYKRRPLSSMERSKRKGKYPYYGASGIIDTIDDYIFEGEHVLISEDGENLRTRQTPIAFLADGQFWVNNHAHIVKSDWLHNRLICYYFANLDLNPYITGAVQPKLSQESLNRIPLLLPESTEERKRIVSILSSLDDKIDLLHRENATLEQMAETLFRQWFVVEAKEEWEEGKLGDLIVVKYGKDHKKLLDGKIPVIGSGGIMRYADTALYNKESVLIPRKGSLNNTMYINEPFWTVDTMFYTEMRRPNIAKFVFHFMKGQDLANMNVGSAVPSMTTEVLNNIPIDIPPQEVFDRFEKAVASLYNKKEQNNKQIQTLIQTRDGLLPRLMSGEIEF